MSEATKKRKGSIAPSGSRRRVLVACEYSGAVRDAFAGRGWRPAVQQNLF